MRILHEIVHAYERTRTRGTRAAPYPVYKMCSLPHLQPTANTTTTATSTPPTYLSLSSHTIAMAPPSRDLVARIQSHYSELGLSESGTFIGSKKFKNRLFIQYPNEPRLKIREAVNYLLRYGTPLMQADTVLGLICEVSTNLSPSIQPLPTSPPLLLKAPRLLLKPGCAGNTRHIATTKTGR